MKSLHMHTSLAATLPWLVHHYVPTIHPVHQHFSIFLHPGTATLVLNPVTSPHLDTVTHLVTHILECPCFNTGPRGPSFGRLAHSLEAHHHSPAAPGNISLAHTCPPPSLARSRRIWTHPSIPAMPAPGAVWPTTGPKGHLSGWLVHPLSAHHHLPSPSGTLCMCVHVRVLNLAAFPHLDVSVHPCQPSWRTILPLISPSGSNFPMGGVPPRYPPHPISTIPTLHIHAHPLWPTRPPPGLCAHLHTLLHTSVHLAHHFFLGFSYTHSTSCALAHFQLYPMAHG